MANGKRYIKILGVINIIYILLRVGLNMEGISIADLSSALLTLLINLLWTSGIIYAIYKKHNSARLLLSGICVLSLIDNINVYSNGMLDINDLLSVVVAITYIYILAKADVIKYIRSSGKQV